MYIPEHYNQLMPYITVKDAKGFKQFLESAFDATEMLTIPGDNGNITHGEAKIGDSVIMYSEASQQFPVRNAGLFLYVDDVDKTFTKAVAVGAKVWEGLEPSEKDYGRSGSILDTYGNVWSITTAKDSDKQESETNPLEQLEIAWNKEIEKNDVEQMATYMSDKWVIHEGDGSVTTKKMFLDTISKGELEHTKMDFKTRHVTIQGNTGIVMQRGTSEGKWMGNPFSLYEDSTTIFAKRGKVWQAVETIVTPAKK